jgi:hypothetical protein
MGFIIWYKVKFHEQNAGAGGLLSQIASVLPFGASLPFSVSNDVLGGKYILDADITLTMTEGAKASSFSITLTNLPTDAIEMLKSKQAEGLKNCQPLLVDISLGYFGETPDDATMVGAITSIKDSSDAQSGLSKTIIQGFEIGAFNLRTNYEFTPYWKTVNIDDLLKDLVDGTGVKVADQSHVDIEQQTLNDYTISSVSEEKNDLSAMTALKKFVSDAVRKISVPVVIIDNTLYIGSSVGAKAAPISFSPEENIISVEQQMDQQQENDETRDPCKSPPIISYHVVTLGHSGLRVGQKASLDIQPAPFGNLRITDLKHKFLTASGYTCDMTVSIVEPGKVVSSNKGAAAVANGVQKKAQAEQSQAIDVGEVKTYDEKKHKATLNYGQKPEQKDTAPSVQTKVNDKAQLINKPLASLFAWHKCGLIVPIYPGMRALLAHNQNLTNDAIVTGFLWPDQPEYTRPKNEPGDYWLCLPTKLDGNNQPTGKGVNDLTDKSGIRVIQAKGLHIYVGEKDLPDVGTRPSTPDPKTLVIEHESGTKITIANDGAIKIETQEKDISLTNGQGTLTLAGSGDISLQNSGVTLKLGSAGVEVS